MNSAKLVQQGVGWGRKDSKEEGGGVVKNQGILKYACNQAHGLLFPSWPTFLFAPHGIWGLIKESRLGSNGGAESRYEMLLGDCLQVAATRDCQGPF